MVDDHAVSTKDEVEGLVHTTCPVRGHGIGHSVRSPDWHMLQKRLDEEVLQLILDIQRIGGAPNVKFGALFDDDAVQQYYEALVGTLKSAKKRGLISFKGQMLLKGPHDNVVVSVTETGLAHATSSSTDDEPAMTEESPVQVEATA
jgi:hypothetical protein